MLSPVASIHDASVKYDSYQRIDQPGGGKRRTSAELKEIATTSRLGSTSSTKTRIAADTVVTENVAPSGSASSQPATFDSIGVPV